jgi:putative FmdB family regulatory protein
MPLYDYKCPSCGVVSDVWAHMDEQEKLCSCGSWSTRMISASMISCDLEPYWDENLGGRPVFVQSKQHRRQLMHERGLVDKWTSTTSKRWV